MPQNLPRIPSNKSDWTFGAQASSAARFLASPYKPISRQSGAESSFRLLTAQSGPPEPVTGPHAPRVVELEPWQVDEGVVGGGGERSGKPTIYDPGTDTVYVGAPEAHHSEMISHLPEGAIGEGYQTGALNERGPGRHYEHFEFDDIHAKAIAQALGASHRDNWRFAKKKDEMHIGLDIPKDAAVQIRNWVEDQDWPNGAELEPLEDYHITLLFANAEGSSAHREDDWIHHDRHALSVTGVKDFPASEERDGKYPVVLTIESDTIHAHHNRLADGAEEAGMEISRYSKDKYKPHLTVAYTPEVPKLTQPPKLTFESVESSVSEARDEKTEEEKTSEEYKERHKHDHVEASAPYMAELLRFSNDSWQPHDQWPAKQQHAPEGWGCTCAEDPATCLVHAAINDAASPAGKPTDGPRTWRQAKDQWDTREYADSLHMRPMLPPAPIDPTPDGKSCTCGEGHKLDCPLHGLLPDPRIEDSDHAWHIPENNPVGYPQDQLRNYTRPPNVAAADMRVAARTRKQQLENAAYHERELGPDTSKIIHEFPDKWTIRQLQTYADMEREGRLMDNCFSWGCTPEFLHEQWIEHPQAHWTEDGAHMPEDEKINYTLPVTPTLYSLRDSDNLPHLSMDAANENNEPVMGKHNTEPRSDYIDRIHEWARDPRTSNELAQWVMDEYPGSAESGASPVISKAKRKLWLDDTRRPPDDSWDWVHTVKEAIFKLEHEDKSYDHMSLDHDLSMVRYKGKTVVNPSAMSGGDFVLWLHEHGDKKHMPKSVELHTHNQHAIDLMKKTLEQHCEVTIKRAPASLEEDWAKEFKVHEPSEIEKEETPLSEHEAAWEFRIADAPHEPPNLRKADGVAERCYTCAMFWKHEGKRGKCNGFGEWDVDENEMCDEFYPGEHASQSVTKQYKESNWKCPACGEPINDECNCKHCGWNMHTKEHDPSWTVDTANSGIARADL